MLPGGLPWNAIPVLTARPPPPALAPFVVTFARSVVETPDGRVLESFVLDETASVTLMLGGQPEAFVDGRWTAVDGPILVGAQARRLPVRAAGRLVAASIAIRPAGWFSFFDEPAERFADRVVPLAGPWRDRLNAVRPFLDDTEAALAALERVTHEGLTASARPPCPTSTLFEQVSHDDPTRSVAEIAAAAGMSTRSLNRIVRDHFGHLPKTVLRRSRFFDMAAAIRGFGRRDDELVAALRYYDASHLNRECRTFVGMTPAAFRRTPTPLFTPGLDLRRRPLTDAARSRGPASPND